VLLMLGATLCFAALDAPSKHLSQTYPIPMTAWGRYLVLERGTPSHDTFSRVFRILDATIFEQCFAAGSPIWSA